MCYLMFSGFVSLVYKLSTWCFKSLSGLCWESVARGVFVYACCVGGAGVDWCVFRGIDWLVLFGNVIGCL